MSEVCHTSASLDLGDTYLKFDTLFIMDILMLILEF